MTERFAGVVIVAAGRGERFGDSGKVMSETAGRPMLAWSLDSVMQTTSVREMVVVCGTHTRNVIDNLLGAYSGRMPVRTCLGGANRQDSVRAGVECLSRDAEVAVIHDAARPLATPRMFDDVVDSARDHGAAIIATPVTDTIKEVDGNRIVRTIPRDTLWSAQTPQAFRLDVLVKAMESADAGELAFTDEAGLLEHLGIPVMIVPGASTNMKVTVPEDLHLVDVLLHQRRQDGESHVPA